MIKRHPMLIIMLSLLLGLVLGIWIGINIKTTLGEGNTSSQLPIRSVKITIVPSQQDELFVQLSKFADKWRYAIRIEPIDPAGEIFTVQLWRSDMMLSGLYPNDPGTLDIGFFYTNPAVPVPERYFDEEIRDLESFIGEIPNATFSVDN